MAEIMKCEKCGSENPRSNKFCDSCGAKLVMQVAATVQASAPKKEVIRQDKPVKARDENRVQDSIKAPVIYQPGKGMVIDWEMIAWITIMIITIISRFADLGAKPLHHDESMHAFYSWKLFMGNGYSYNPMLHGPFHYHANALMYFLFGACDYTSRVAPAIYGVIGVWMVYLLRPVMGRTGTVIAAFIMAISPTFMYQARFIREDIFMAVDTLALFVGLVRYFDSRSPKWLYLAAVGLALSWATKEATYITLFIFGTFFIFCWIWDYFGKTDPDNPVKDGIIYDIVEYWMKDGAKVFLTALGIFVGVHAALYFNKEPSASFLTNLKGVWDGYTWALTYWLGQHGVERGSQPGYFYILLLPFYEMLAVSFTLIASVYYIVVKQKRVFFNIFCIYWWIMSVLIYSWAGEKMPWLAIHPLLPMIILAGKFIGEIYESKTGELKLSITTAAFVLLSMASIHGAIYVCFYGEGASPKESLVYVQSSTDVTKVVKSTEKFAATLKTLKWDSGSFRSYDKYNIEMVIEDYCSWPFAWYFRDFKRIAYPPKDIPDSDIGKPIIFSGIEEANAGHDERVRSKLEKDYVYYRYKLREWWAPDEQKWWDADRGAQIDMLWKRFIYRDVWNELGSYDFVVYIRKDLDKYWEH